MKTKEILIISAIFGLILGFSTNGFSAIFNTITRVISEVRNTYLPDGFSSKTEVAVILDAQDFQDTDIDQDAKKVGFSKEPSSAANDSSFGSIQPRNILPELNESLNVSQKYVDRKIGPRGVAPAQREQLAYNKFNDKSERPYLASKKELIGDEGDQLARQIQEAERINGTARVRGSNTGFIPQLPAITDGPDDGLDDFFSDTSYNTEGDSGGDDSDNFTPTVDDGPDSTDPGGDNSPSPDIDFNSSDPSGPGDNLFGGPFLGDRNCDGQFSLHQGGSTADDDCPDLFSTEVEAQDDATASSKGLGGDDDYDNTPNSDDDSQNTEESSGGDEVEDPEDELYVTLTQNANIRLETSTHYCTYSVDKLELYLSGNVIAHLFNTNPDCMTIEEFEFDANLGWADHLQQITITNSALITLNAQAQQCVLAVNYVSLYSSQNVSVDLISDQINCFGMNLNEGSDEDPSDDTDSSSEASFSTIKSVF